MQWLIDIITASVLADIGTVLGFVDRGDPAAQDFGPGSFTADGTWRELDLSTIVPAAATAVAVSLDVECDAAGRTLMFRKAGNSNAYNIAIAHTVGAYDKVAADLVIPISSARKIEYNINAGSYNVLNFTVKGWFTP